MTLLGLATSLIRRKYMSGIEPITFHNILSLKMWFNIFFNPWIFLILSIVGTGFFVNLWVANMLGVNEQAIFGWSLALPSFLLTFFATKMFLGEVIQETKYYYLILFFVSIITGTWWEIVILK